MTMLTLTKPRDEGISKVRLVPVAAKSRLPKSLPHVGKCVSLVGQRVLHLTTAFVTLSIVVGYVSSTH